MVVETEQFYWSTSLRILLKIDALKSDVLRHWTNLIIKFYTKQFWNKQILNQSKFGEFNKKSINQVLRNFWILNFNF